MQTRKITKIHETIREKKQKNKQERVKSRNQVNENGEYDMILRNIIVEVSAKKEESDRLTGSSEWTSAESEWERSKTPESFSQMSAHCVWTHCNKMIHDRKRQEMPHVMPF